MVVKALPVQEKVDAREPNGIFSRRPSTAASAVLSSRVFRPRIIREKVVRNTVRHPDSRVPHRVLRVVSQDVV